MATPRKPGGYADGDLLRRALRRNEELRELLARAAEVMAQDRRLAATAVRLAGLLASQHGDLVEMGVIRALRKQNDE